VTPEQYRRIKAVLAEAMQRPETERDAYVAGASGGDAEFELEVRSLLSSSAQAADMFETGAFAVIISSWP
jgi:hypothetical protein